MVYTQPNICPGEWHTQTPLEFWYTDDHFMTRLYYTQQKKRTCKIVDFAVLADYTVKLKQSEKKDKYFDLARELKNCGTWKWCLYQL